MKGGNAGPELRRAGTAGARSPRTWLDRPFVVHPWLIGLPAILAFTYENKNMSTWTAAIYPAVLTWIPTSFVLIALWLLLGHARKAGIIASLLVFGFHAHGHVADAIGDAFKAVGSRAPRGVDWEWWFWALIAAVSLFIAWRKSRFDVLTTFLNLLAAVAIFPAVVQFVQYNAAEHRPVASETRLADLPKLDVPASPPDIWYFVFDGYGRADVLQEFYGIPPELPEKLRSKGFFVADAARSNYAQTALSFAATLNMDFVPTLLEKDDPKSMYRVPLGQLVGRNRVVSTLRNAGYEIVTYPSEYSLTHLQGADVERRPWLYFTEFEYILTNDTALLPFTQALGFPQSRVAHAIRRNHIQWTFDDIVRSEDRPGPTFTFVHIVAPHPPFVFTPDGGYRPSNATASFADGNSWIKKSAKYKETYDAGYREQTLYLNAQLERAIDAILARSAPRPIILIQGDHGPALKLDWASMQRTDMRERHGILAAYYFPDGDYSRLKPEMTPVNSFRVVFDQFFGADLAMLEDTSYFTLWSRPYNPIDVTDRARGASAEPAPAEPPPTDDEAHADDDH